VCCVANMACPTATAQPQEEEELQNVPSVKAYKNTEFLSSPTARHIRIMCEMEEPMKRLTENKVDNYFLFVGSHVLMHPQERATQLAMLKNKLKSGGPRDEVEAITAKVRFAERLLPMDKYYVVAQEIAEKIACWSKERSAKGLSEFHVCTGGGPGVMEAANRGAHNKGALTLGFGSTRPEWGNMNKYVSEQGAFEFHYFFMRKFWMAYKCMGLIVLPGGYGSLDELFELLALLSSKKMTHKVPIILVGTNFWKKAIDFDFLRGTMMLSDQHTSLFVYKDTAQEVFEYLVEQATQAAETGENNTVEAAKRRRLAAASSNEGA